MKPIQAKIWHGKESDVFGVKVVDLPYFSTVFHFHEECQLNYIIKSEGRRLIGNSVDDFGPDELILVGSNVPHVWYNDTRYFSNNLPADRARSISLFLHPDKLLTLLSQLGDTQKLAHILELSKCGLKFYGETKTQLKHLLFEIKAEKDMLGYLSPLVNILQILCNISEFEKLSNPDCTNVYQMQENSRMDKVLKYIFDHFHTPLKLEEVADLAYMSRHAFCRFFKNRTQRTFMEFVTEVRIGQACRLIAEGEKQITCLAYECGFNSLSNFNKLFKDIKGSTPSEYRKALTEAIPLMK